MTLRKTPLVVLALFQVLLTLYFGALLASGSTVGRRRTGNQDPGNGAQSRPDISKTLSDKQLYNLTHGRPPTPVGTPPTTVQSGFSVVHLYRSGGFNENLRRTPPLYVDQTVLAQSLARGRFLSVTLPAGQHTFYSPGGSYLPLDLASGEHYYIKVDMNLAVAHLSLARDRDGEKEIRKRQHEETQVVSVIAPPIQAARSRVEVNLSSANPLLLEDLTASFREMGLDPINTDAPFKITIAQLEFDYTSKPEQRQKITYDRFRVNWGTALFEMPDNSVYQFEYTTGADELTYAYEITIRSGNQPRKDLFRGTKVFEWSTCGSPMIINAFGGVKQVNRMANDEMKALCETPQPKKSRQAATITVLQALSARVRALVDTPSTAEAPATQGSNDDPRPQLRVFVDPTNPLLAEITEGLTRECAECQPQIQRETADVVFVVSRDTSGRISWSVFETLTGTLIGHGQGDGISEIVKSGVVAIRSLKRN